MRICVCVKQVFFTGIPFEIDEESGKGLQKGSERIYTMNRPDRSALEVAIQLRNKIGGAVFAVTLGPSEANEVLYACLGRGADEGIHIVDDYFNATDPYLTALCLSRVIRNLGCDLILCGAGSCDSNNSQVPSILAELLDLPQISRVIKLKCHYTSMTVRATRRLSKGNREIVEAPLPAVIGVEAAIAEPHYVSIHSRTAASRRGMIKTHSSVSLLEEMGGQSPLLHEIRQSLPRPRPRAIIAPDAKTSASQRLQFIMTGGIAAKEDSTLLEGESEKTLGEIVKVLKREQVI